jgi:hypothetical protein
MLSSFMIVCNTLFSGRYSFFNFCCDIHLLLKLQTKKRGSVLILLSSHFSLAGAIYLRVVITKGYEIIKNTYILTGCSDHTSF